MGGQGGGGRPRHLSQDARNPPGAIQPLPHLLHAPHVAPPLRDAGPPLMSPPPWDELGRQSTTILAVAPSMNRAGVLSSILPRRHDHPGPQPIQEVTAGADLRPRSCDDGAAAGGPALVGPADQQS